MSDLLGAYQLRARSQPLLLAAFPVAVTALAWGVPELTVSRLLGMAVAFGVATVLVGLIRDRGTRLQPELWASWGGPPTTAMLMSNSGKTAPDLPIHRGHVRRLLPEVPALSDELDRERPDVSQRVVEQYVAHLRERTRDRGRFPVVFDNNVAYGFRRNMLGLRPVGVGIAAMCALVAVLGLVLSLRSDLNLSSPALLAAMVADGLAVVLWLRVSPAWVEVQADRYAVALLAAAEGVQRRDPSPVDIG